MQDSHDDCPICFEAVDPIDAVLACDAEHAYHRDCLAAWIQEGKLGCPYCRQPLKSNVLKMVPINRSWIFRMIQNGAPADDIVAALLQLDDFSVRGDCASHNGTTIIHCACGVDRPDVLEKIWSLGRTDVPYTEESRDGITPLHTAACCSARCAGFLLYRAGVDPNPTNRFGQTPLRIAISHGNYNVIQLLDDYSQQVDPGTSGARKFVDFRKRCSLGSSPLEAAISSNNLFAVHILCARAAETGVDVDEPNTPANRITPLMRAALFNRMEIAKLILAAAPCWQSTLQATDAAGRTALRCALEYGYVDFANFLANYNAELTEVILTD
jgi:ankyrin repeat protein